MSSESKEQERSAKKKQANENFGFIKQEFEEKKWNSRQKKRLLIILGVFLLAILFGIIASISYKATDYILTNIMEDNQREDVKFPNQTVPGTAVGDNGDGGNTTVDPTILEQYSQLLQGIWQMADELAPGIVTITAVKEDYDAIFEEATEVSTNLTGIILADNQLEYLILVNYTDLLAAEAEILYATFCNAAVSKAEVLAVNEELDLAVVRASHKDFTEEQMQGIRVIAVGDSSKLSPGALVVAVGSPTGRHLSVDAGMVSSVGETVYITDSSVSLIATNMYGYEKGFGILVNSSGEMVGILTRKFAGDQEILQAYSVNELNPILQYMVNGKQPNYFGVLFEELPAAVLEEASIENGILITEVKEDSPAYRQGFRRGDLITKVGENDIYFASQFFTVLNNYLVDQEVRVTFYRNGREMSKSIVIQQGK